MSAAAVGGFDETLPMAKLEGSTFTIFAIRAVTTKFGHRHIAEVEVDGLLAEAWLNGVVVDRQIKTVLLAEGALPATVTLGRDGRFEPSPYRLYPVTA